MTEVFSAVDRIYRRVFHMVARGRVTLVDDSQGVQTLQGKFKTDDIRDAMPRLAEYGFSSNPPAGSDFVALFFAGERSNGAVVATNHQASRPTRLSSGDAQLYDNRGSRVWLAADGLHIHTSGLPVIIETDSGLQANVTGGQVLLTCPGGTVLNSNLQVNGNLSVAGNTVLTGTVTNNGINTGSTHEHGGVQTGSGHTTGPF